MQWTCLHPRHGSRKGLAGWLHRPPAGLLAHPSPWAEGNSRVRSVTGTRSVAVTKAPRSRPLGGLDEGLCPAPARWPVAATKFDEDGAHRLGGRLRGRRRQRPRRCPLCFLLNAGRRAGTPASSLSRSPPPFPATPSPSTYSSRRTSPQERARWVLRRQERAGGRARWRRSSGSGSRPLVLVSPQRGAAHFFASRC